MTDEKVTLERVGELALFELVRRLNDPKLAEELPGTSLLQLANSYVKIMAEREEETEREDFDNPLEAIVESGLPADRVVELLEDLMRQQRDAVDETAAKIEELLEAQA